MLKKVIFIVTLIMAVTFVLMRATLGELWIEFTVKKEDLYEPVLIVENELQSDELSFSEPFTLKYPGSYQVALFMTRNSELQDGQGGIFRAEILIRNSLNEVVIDQVVSEGFDPRTHSMTLLHFSSKTVGVGKESVLNFEISQKSGNLFSERLTYGVVVVRDPSLLR